MRGLALYAVCAAVLLLGCGSSKKCDSSSCTGCCDSSGSCKSGTADSACGKNGAACAACSSSQTCTASACTASATDAGLGVDAYCNPGAGLQCGSPLSCFNLGGGDGGVCSEVCTGTCPAGSSCVSLGPVTACVVTCSSPASCGTGETCATLPGGTNACIPDCRAFPDLCGAGTACTLGICAQVGSQTFGQPCNGPADAGACAQGLTCLRFQQAAPQGFCSQPCSGTSPCPNSPAGAACDVTVTGAGTFCAFPCAGPDAGCPAGLSCQPTGGTGSACQ
ncbi:MAG TPA: hypothetical protein VH208_13055 [Myxococcaceae bacterium]|nr:hypothetical protein [Myxococcaceae bacterium]